MNNLLKRILALINTKFTRLGIQKAQFRQLGTSLLSACNFKCWFFFIIATTFTSLISFIINEWARGGRAGAGGSIKIYDIIAIKIVLVNNTCHCKSRVR